MWDKKKGIVKEQELKFRNSPTYIFILPFNRNYRAFTHRWVMRPPVFAPGECLLCEIVDNVKK